MPNKDVRRLSTRLTGGGTLYRDVLAEMFRLAPTELRNLLLGHLRARNYKGLLDWADTVDPQTYGSATDCYVGCQLSAFVKKYPFNTDEVPGLDPGAAALKSFKLAEHRCKRYNLRARLKRRRFNPHAQIYAYAREYVLRCIGDKPDIEAILDLCNFTGGASLGVHGNKTNIMRKIYADCWTVTPGARFYAKLALWRNIHARDCILPGAIKCYDPSLFETLVNAKCRAVGYNKTTFISKTAKTDRSIATEPLLNGILQKGADVYLRGKLLAVGINLKDRRVNQTLARVGSRGGFNPYCTIDLSMASDSLATEVVRDLLPPDWFDFLLDLRSPGYMLPDGIVRKYEKFCSMGNGFCFPLETLVFASICHAVERFVNGVATNDFSVYGDDIIVRQNVSLLIIEILRDIGFKVNTNKTFITGPFRESCGADWYDGQDVRPVQLKRRLTDIRHVFALHNSTLRSNRTEMYFTSIRPILRDSIKKPYRRPGREPGDTCFSVPLDEAMGSKFCTWDKDNQQFKWRELLSLPVPDKFEDWEHLTVNEREVALCYAVMQGSLSESPFAVRYTTEPRNVWVSRPYKDGYHQMLPVAHFGHVREILRFFSKVGGAEGGWAD